MKTIYVAPVIAFYSLRIHSVVCTSLIGNEVTNEGYSSEEETFTW